MNTEFNGILPSPIFSIFNYSNDHEIKSPNDDVESIAEKTPLIPTNLSKEEVRHNSRLNQPRHPNFPISLDLQLFAHEAAAAYINKFKYEGISINKTIDSFINLLSFEKDLPLTNDFTLYLIQLFSKCLIYAKELDEFDSKEKSFENDGLDHLTKDYQKKYEKTLNNRKEMLLEFSSKLFKDIQNLKIGHRLLMPGGWRTDGVGHSILYLFQRTSEQHYNFILFNTGDGLNYHPSYVNSKGEKKFQLFLEFKGIPIDDVLNKEFFEVLFAINYAYIWSFADKEDSYGDRYIDLYSIFLPNFGEYLQKPNDKLNLFYIKPQRSGTCSMKCLLAAVRYLMITCNNDANSGLSAYKHLRYIYQRHAIIKTCLGYFKNDVTYDRSAHRLITDAVRILSRSAVKLHNKKILNDEEINGCLATVVDIRSRLKFKKELHQVQLAKSEEHNSSGELTIAVPSIFTDVFKFSTSVDLPREYDSTLYPLYKLPVLKSVSSQDIVEYLSAWSECKLEDDNQKKIMIINQIIHELRKLPIPSIDNIQLSIWSSIPRDKIEVCLKGLYTISKNLLFPESNYKYLIVASHNHFVEFHSILCIADFLARSVKENKLDGFNLPVHFLVRYIEKSTYFIVNPVTQERLNKIIKYFIPNIDFRVEVTSENYLPNSKKTIFTICYDHYQKVKPLIISEKTIETNAELRFYKQFIEDLKRSPHNPLLENTKDYLAYIAKHSFLNSSTIIPKSVVYLRNIAMLCQIIETSDWSFYSNAIPPSDINFEFIYSSKDPASESNGDSDYEEEFVSDDEFPVDDELEMKDSIKLYLYLREEGRKFNSDETEVTECSFDNKLNKHPAFDNRSVEGFTVEKGHQNDLNNENDTTIQGTNTHDDLIRVLVYMEKKPQNSYTPEQKKLIKMHFFRYNNLFSQILQYPHSIIKIVNLLHKNIEYLVGLKNWEDAFFFIEIANHFVNYAKYAQKIHPEKNFSLPKGVLRDYKQWSIEFILPQIKDDDQMTVNLLSLFVVFNISKEGIISFDNWIAEFSVDWFVLKRTAKLKKIANLNEVLSKANIGVHSLIDTLMPYSIQKLTNDPVFRNTVLNQIISPFSNKKQNLDWTGEYPIYNSGSFKMDLKNCIINGDDNLLESLPNYIINSYSKAGSSNKINDGDSDEVEIEQLEVSLFDGIKEIKKISSNEFGVKDANNDTTIQLKNNKIHIYRFIDQISYKLITVPMTNNEISIYLNYHQLSYNLHLILPLFVESESMLWISSNPDPHCLVQNKNGNTYYLFGLKFKLNDDLDQFKISSISNRKDGSTVLLNQNSIKNHEKLEAFATEKKVLLWADSNDLSQILEIEMPLLKQKFVRSKDKNSINRFFSQQNIGFYISDNQFDQFQNKWPPYLVLENENKKKIVLMLEISGIIKEKHKNFDPIPKVNCTSIVHCYDVEMVAGKTVLRPQSVVGALNLVIAWIQIARHKMALDLIPECLKQTPYTKKEIKLCRLLLNSTFWGTHPSLVFLRLKFLSECNLSECNLLDFSDVDTDLLSFYNQLNNTNIGSFTISEETNLYKEISEETNLYKEKRINNSQQTLQRLQFLDNPNQYSEIVDSYVKNKLDVKISTYLRHIKDLYSNYISKPALELLKKKIKASNSVDPSSQEADEVTIDLPYRPIKLIRHRKKEISYLLNQITSKISLLKSMKVKLSLPLNLDRLDEGWNQRINTLKTFDHDSLCAHFDALNKKLEQFEKKLISQANSISSRANTIEGLLHQGRVKKKVFLKDILTLFELGNVEDYAEATYLSNEQIINLDHEVAIYLIEKTRIAQLKRIVVLKKELLSLLDPVDRQLKELEINKEFIARRSYSFTLGSDDEPPSPKRQRLDNSGLKQNTGFIDNTMKKYLRIFLLMEAQNEIFLRDLQVNIINEIDNNEKFTEKLVVAGTGSGKSTTIAPLAERIRETEKRLVFNVWPQSLFNINQENMEKNVRNTFGQKSISFQFNRNSLLTNNELNNLYRKLIWARYERYQINTTPESLQSFQLKYLEVLYEICCGRNDKIDLTMFQKILTLINESEFHIDEAQINLSPKKEVCFTIGSPKSEPTERFEFVDEIFQFLTSDKVESILGLKQDLQRFVNKEVLNTILNDLVVHISKSLNVTKDQLPTFLDYIWKGKVSPWMYKHPKEEFFVLLHQHINVLFPTIFQRSVNVNFGLSKINKETLYAKPYHGNDTPIETADYENTYETLCKSYLIYLYQGLSPDNLWDVVLFLQKVALRESREKQIDLDTTNSSLMFKRFFGVDNGSLFAIQRKDIGLYYKAYKGSTELILFFVKKFVAPTIKAYSLKLKSSPQDLLSLSHNKNIALTATPGNPNIYRSNMNIVSIGSSEIQVKEKLISDRCPIHIVQSCLPRDILDHAIKLLEKDFRMLIDVGALFKGINNKSVAEAILNYYQNDLAIQGVVFFDDSDQLQVLKKGYTKTMPISQSGLVPDQLFTYCDQRHAFGTDTKQMLKAKALGTFDLITTKDEIIQGTGRLRGFLQSQKVEWLLTEDTRKKMYLTGDINIENMMEFAEATQLRQEQESIFRSLKHQMNQEVRTTLFNILININAPDLLSSFFLDISRFFIEEVNSSLKLPVDRITSDQSVNPLISHLNLLKNKVINSSMLLEDTKKHLISRLNSYYKKIDDFVTEVSKNSANTKSSTLFTAGDLETEVQNQNEIQIHNDNHTELEQSSHISNYYKKRIERLWPNNFSIYSYNWNYRLRKLPHIQNEYVPLCKVNTLLNFHFENNISSVGDLLFPLDIFEAISESMSPLPSDIDEEFSERDVKNENEIFCTSNFLTEEPFTSSLKKLVSPFAQEQKSVFEFLVIEDKLANENQSRWTIILGDQSADAMFWREYLSKISPSEAQGKTRRACLYDLNFGIVVDSPNPFSDEELSGDYEFQKMVTRIKLFNGDIEFNQIQRGILSELAPTPEKKKILRKFFERIIQWKFEKKRLYEDSWLKSFLN